MEKNLKNNMIKRILDYFKNGEKAVHSITGAAVIIAVMGLASRLLGLVRDRILASRFGAGDELDIYYAAFKIPDLVFNLLILGALSAAFVPVFTSLVSRDGKKEAWEMVNKVLTLMIIVLIFVTAILFFLTPWLTSLITFGFSSEKQSLVSALTRIMLFSPILMGVSGLFGGILNSFKKFFFYSLAPIFYNVGIIIGVLFFTGHFGVQGLAWGVVLGAFLHLIVQLPETLRCGMKFKINFDFKDKNLYRIVQLMVPRTMGLAVAQINLLVVTILASTLRAGSLSVFNLANNIQSVPLGLFGISFATAAFPTLSACWAQNKKDDFVENFSKTFRSIMFFAIPFSVIFIVLRAQIVRVVLGAGKFDWEDTIMTFQSLGIFSLSLFAQSLIPLLARAFFSIHNTKTPFLVGLFSGATNLVLALFLIEKYQTLGLVFAFTFSSILNMLLLLVLLRKKVGNLDEQTIIKSTWKIIFVSLVMAIFMQITKYGMSYIVNMDTFLGVFSQMATSFFVGIAIFVLIGKLTGIEELKYFSNGIRKKIFFNTKTVCGESGEEL